MIRINLLPARRGRLELQRLLTLAIGLILAAGALGGWLYDEQSRELNQHQRHLRRIEAELKALEEVVKEVRQFETQKAALEQKREVIANLHASQRRPARILDAVSRLLPEQVWLEQLREGGRGLAITGKSFDNVGIASFMENLERSTFFEGIALVESKSEVLQGRQIKAFTVTMKLRLPAATPQEDVS